MVTADKDQRAEIDKRSYLVKDSARTQSANALDILGEVPAVTVTPSGQLRLLGSGGVKVLVDGKEVSDATSFLRTLPGARIKRIEVMTNPSAQYSAAGTAGIINLVLRVPPSRQSKANLSVAGGSFGSFEAKISPTWSDGRWSAMGTIGRTRWTGRTAFDSRQISSPFVAGSELSESGATRATNDGISGNGTLTFKPDDRQDLSLMINMSRADGRSLRSSELFQSILSTNQVSNSVSSAESQDVSLSYKVQLSKKGETATITAASGYIKADGLNDFSSTNGSAFSTATGYQGRTLSLTLSYVKPLQSQTRLSAGASMKRDESDSTDFQAGTSPFGIPRPAQASRIQGHWTELAGYATYQFPLSKWLLMPGARVEGRQYDLNFGTNNDERKFYLFPSLHLQHDLRSNLKFSASYSRRIAQPAVVQLSPILRFSDPTTASSGNPRLRPELTDSIESKLEYGWAKQTAILTLFHRITHAPWIDRTTANSDGVFISMPTNIGTRVRSGVNLSMQGPISGDVRYSANATVADQTYDIGLPSNRSEAIDYSGSLQIEWRDRGDEGAGFDSVVANARYNGPTRSPYTTTTAFSTIELTWTHGLTNKMLGVLKISNLFGDLLIEQAGRYSAVSTGRVDRIMGPRAMVSLTYRIGSR